MEIHLIDGSLLKKIVLSDTRFIVLDVRTKEEYTAFSINGSINIPVDELPKRLSELDKEKQYICICAHGVRSLHAAKILHHAGWRKVFSVDGGYTNLNFN